MAESIQVGNIGTVLSVTFKEDGASVDISAATTKTISFMKPSSSVQSHTAAFLTDGTDGILTYTIGDDSLDVDEAGNYKLQGKIVEASGDTWYTTIGTLDVKANL